MIMKAAVLRKRYFDTAVADVLRAASGGSLVGSSALALCVLDHLAYLRSPCEKHTPDDYKLLVADYLVPTNAGYRPEEIYAWRCSLVHTYAKAHAFKNLGLGGVQMTHRQPEQHLQPGVGVLIVNVDTFIADVVWAVRSFFDKGFYVEERAKSLIKVWTPIDLLSLWYADAQQAARPYSDMHHSLRELDSPTPDLERLRADITALFPNGDSLLSRAPTGNADLSF